MPPALQFTFAGAMLLAAIERWTREIGREWQADDEDRAAAMLLLYGAPPLPDIPTTRGDARAAAAPLDDDLVLDLARQRAARRHQERPRQLYRSTVLLVAMGFAEKCADWPARLPLAWAFGGDPQSVAEARALAALGGSALTFEEAVRVQTSARLEELRAAGRSRFDRLGVVVGDNDGRGAWRHPAPEVFVYSKRLLAHCTASAGLAIAHFEGGCRLDDLSLGNQAIELVLGGDQLPRVPLAEVAAAPIPSAPAPLRLLNADRVFADTHQAMPAPAAVAQKNEESTAPAGPASAEPLAEIAASPPIVPAPLRLPDADRVCEGTPQVMPGSSEQPASPRAGRPATEAAGKVGEEEGERISTWAKIRERILRLHPGYSGCLDPKTLREGLHVHTGKSRREPAWAWARDVDSYVPRNCDCDYCIGDRTLGK
jgi:hypothetical protein